MPDGRITHKCHSHNPGNSAALRDGSYSSTIRTDVKLHNPQQFVSYVAEKHNHDNLVGLHAGDRQFSSSKNICYVL